MVKEIKCSQCRNINIINSPESFNNAQEISVLRHTKRYRCEADISNYFSDVEIKKIRDCNKFRPRILTFKQELFQKLIIFPKLLLNFFFKKNIK